MTKIQNGVAIGKKSIPAKTNGDKMNCYFMFLMFVWINQQKQNTLSFRFSSRFSSDSSSDREKFRNIHYKHNWFLPLFLKFHQLAQLPKYRGFAPFFNRLRVSPELYLIEQNRSPVIIHTKVVLSIYSFIRLHHTFLIQVSFET